MFEIISCWILLLLAALVIVGDRFLKFRPDCQLEASENDCSNFQFISRGSQEWHISFKGKLKNFSPAEQGIIIDAIVAVEPEDKWKNAEIWCQVRNLSIDSPLQSYWEAYMLKPKGTLSYQVNILVRNHQGELFQLQEPVRLALAFLYYGKNTLQWKRIPFSFPANIWQKAEAQPLTAVSPSPSSHSNVSKFQLKTIPINDQMEVIPVRTRLLRPGDNMAEIINSYVKPIASNGDIVAIAESALAIVQGRTYHVMDIRPGFWATRLNKFFHYNSSLGSVYSMQVAIQEVGLFKILTGILAGTIGRLLKRKGDFYRITGRQAATIDDCAGTIPPFDKFVVLGPEAPRKAAFHLKKETGLEIAIVDVNDLRKVDILGKSDGVDVSTLTIALMDNPQGNANEQTPIVIIKKKKALSS